MHKSKDFKRLQAYEIIWIICARLSTFRRR
jgi:hypothetical protein